MAERQRNLALQPGMTASIAAWRSRVTHGEKWLPLAGIQHGQLTAACHLTLPLGQGPAFG
jgi:hypothetical protein